MSVGAPRGSGGFSTSPIYHENNVLYEWIPLRHRLFFFLSYMLALFICWDHKAPLTPAISTHNTVHLKRTCHLVPGCSAVYTCTNVDNCVQHCNCVQLYKCVQLSNFVQLYHFIQLCAIVYNSPHSTFRNSILFGVQCYTCAWACAVQHYLAGRSIF